MNELLDAIEFNWQCLLTTRAVFTNAQFGMTKDYRTPSFYTDRNIVLSISWEKIGEFESNLDPKRLNYWHNANFVIRLYGILDEHKMLTPETRSRSTVLTLIHLLRNKIGAHQDGLKKPKKKYLLEVNMLFEKLNIPRMDIDEISNFNLAIDGVMLKIKRTLVEDVHRLYY